MPATRGVGPAGLGLKASLEALLPALIGAVAGWSMALFLVRVVGPDPRLDPAAVSDAARQAGLSFALGTLVLGAVAALRARSLTERPLGSRSGVARWLPWEALVLGLALWSWDRIGSGVPVATGDGVPEVDLFALAFPLLFMVGTVALSARMLRLVLATLRGRGDRLPHAGYLALRRLTAAPHTVVLLFAATALAVGVLVYSSALGRTLDATLRAKALVSVGSDVSVNLVGEQPVPEALQGSTTMVRRLDQLQRGERVDVLGVDPRTFARAAYWDASFSGSSLEGLLRRLQEPFAAGDRVPSLFVDEPDVASIDFVDPRIRSLPLREVASVDVFPGMTASRPMVVIPIAAIAELGVAPNRLLWVKGDTEAIVREITGVGPSRPFRTHRGRHRRHRLVPHHPLDVRLFSVSWAGRRAHHRGRARALPGRQAAVEKGVLRLPPPDGPEPARPSVVAHVRGGDDACAVSSPGRPWPARLPPSSTSGWIPFRASHQSRSCVSPGSPWPCSAWPPSRSPRSAPGWHRAPPTRATRPRS